MAVDQQQQRFRGIRLAMIAKTGGVVHRLTPRAGEPIWVDEVSLVHPPVAGQGAVDACVEIGTRDLVLATLSAEAPHAALETPVLLDEEFCFYVTPHGGIDSDSDVEVDSDTDTDTEDGVAVYFSCVALTPSSPDTEEEEEDEEAVSSEDDDDEKNHEEESEGNDTEDDDDVMSSECEDTASSDEEVESKDGDDKIYEDDEESGDDVDKIRESSAGDNPKDGQHFRLVAARTFLGLFLFNYIIAFFRLLM